MLLCAEWQEVIGWWGRQNEPIFLLLEGIGSPAPSCERRTYADSEEPAWVLFLRAKWIGRAARKPAP